MTLLTDVAVSALTAEASLFDELCASLTFVLANRYFDQRID